MRECLGGKVANQAALASRAAELVVQIGAQYRQTGHLKHTRTHILWASWVLGSGSWIRQDRRRGGACSLVALMRILTSPPSVHPPRTNGDNPVIPVSNQRFAAARRWVRRPDSFNSIYIRMRTLNIVQK